MARSLPFVWLALLPLACGGSEPSARAPAPAASAPAPLAPQPQALLLTDQALETFATQGDQAAQPLLRQALDTWERESGQPARWFESSSVASTPHSLEQTLAAIAPSGRWLARSEHDTISIFDSTCHRRFVLDAHKGPVRSLTFDPHGRLWSCGADQTIRVWDPTEGKLVHSAAEQQDADRLVLSPDGATIVHRCGRYLCLRPTAIPTAEPRRLRAPLPCLVPRHMPSKDTLIAGNEGDEICLLSLTAGTVDKSLPFVSGSLVFPLRGDTFLTALPGARTVRVEVWSASAGQRVRSLSSAAEDGTPAVAQTMPSLSADGTHAVALTQLRELTRWDTTTGKVSRRLPLPSDTGRADYLADGRVLLSHATGGGFDIAAAGFDSVSPGLVVPQLTYNTLETSPDGTHFAVGVQEIVQLWSLATALPVATLRDDEPLGRVGLVRFSADGARLAVLHSRGLRVWETASRKVIHVARPEEGTRITAVAFDSLGRLVVTKSAHPLPPNQDPKAGERVTTELANATASRAGVYIGAHTAVQISAHAERVALAPPGRGIRVFDDRAFLREIPVVGTWSLSPDGAYVAYVGVSTKPAKRGSPPETPSLRIVRVADGTEKRVDVSTPAGPMSWRADGSALAASVTGEDGGHDVVIVDPASSAVTARLRLGAPAGTYYLSLLPDGQRLVTRQRDGGMTFHGLRDGRVVASLGFMDDGETWLAFTEPGVYDMGGPRSDSLVGCRVGSRVLPFPLCATRFRVPGLLAKALAP
jgi:WD40 repeat protein